jgi:hypothetical protein
MAKHTRMPRKPLIYLVVILPLFVAGSLCVVLGLVLAYSRLNGIPPSAVPNFNGILISLPALILWIPVALFLGNFILYCVPPFRRIAERYASESRRPGFVESQKELLKVTLVFASICIPLIVLGFIL